MTLNLITTLLLLHSLEFGAQYGFNLPLGNIGRFYSLTSSSSLFLGYNKFDISYIFSRYIGKKRINDYLDIHSIALSYKYPFYQKEYRQFSAVIGGNYNRIIRQFEAGNEKNYALGIKFGIEHQENLGRVGFISGIFLDQIIQCDNKHNLQQISSTYFLSIKTGINIKFPKRRKIQKETIATSTVPIVDKEPQIEEIKPILYFAPIYFNFNDSKIQPTAEESLKVYAQRLKNNNTINIIIEGHCCPIGTFDYNLALGWRRAIATQEFLIKLGIDKNRISVISYGEEHLLTENPEDYWMNRRCEFKIK